MFLKINHQFLLTLMLKWIMVENEDLFGFKCKRIWKMMFMLFFLNRILKQTKDILQCSCTTFDEVKNLGKLPPLVCFNIHMFQHSWPYGHSAILFYNPLGERFKLSFSLVADWLWLQQHWIVMRHLWVVLWISVLVKCCSLQKQKKCAKNASLRRFWHFACDGHEPLLSRQQWCEEELQFLGISTVQRTTCVCWLYHIDPRVSFPPDARESFLDPTDQGRL